ncbi:MAG: tetratricopeptide repeat protein, partial [Spirochaetaceae bacterium]|nr:tetratricopeptide repeat protein [Spirochaetaceae bacterium]
AYDRTNKYLDYYRSILKKVRPNLKKELTNAAILKAKNEDFDLAEEIFVALHGFDPEDLITILNMALFFDQRAESYRRAGLFEDADAYDADALQYYTEAMDADPPLPDAYFNAAFYYMKQNDFVRAKDCMETYLALTVDVPDKEMGENGIYKKNRAQEVIDKIRNGNLEDASFHKAYKMIRDGEEEKGIKLIGEFLQKNPKVWNAWFLLGWGLRQLERFSDAEKSFLKALEVGKDFGAENCDTYNELSICCLENGKPDEARTYLFKALAIEPENTKVLSNLAYIALRLGKIAEAQKYFSTVLEIDPKDKIAIAELAKLENDSQ